MKSRSQVLIDQKSNYKPKVFAKMLNKILKRQRQRQRQRLGAAENNKPSLLEPQGEPDQVKLKKL